MKIASKLPPGARVLKRTTSRCMVCGASAPGVVYALGGKVALQRTCRAHGAQSALLSSDERFYHLSRGSASCGSGCGCGPEEPTPADAAPWINAEKPAAGADPFEVLSTCLALIEIVDSCNLACPTCYADSPHKAAVDCLPFEEFCRRVDAVVARKGAIDILQLSGGEPTLHPRFFDLLAWAQDHPKIGYVLVNTNGLRLASDPAFAAEMDRRYRRGKVQLYLQFDGTEEPGQRELRGADLRETRRRALEACGAMEGGGLPVTLAMTVGRLNLGQLWSSVRFGLGFPHVRGVAFQPMFYSGRAPAPEGPIRLNTADLILGLVEQSAGQLKFEDFTPLPCGDPNCATIGYLLKTDQGPRSISDFIDFSRLQGFLANRLNYTLQDLARCGCESEPLGEALKRFELEPARTFRLFIKPFMDASTWDDDRIDRCCTHVIRPDGKLDSFCRYYSGLPGTWHHPEVATARRREVAVVGDELDAVRATIR